MLNYCVMNVGLHVDGVGGATMQPVVCLFSLPFAPVACLKILACVFLC